jgi:hypothetical protein
MLLFLLLSSAINLTISPAYGFALLPVKVRISLQEPAHKVCVFFSVDSSEPWYSCFDGDPDTYNYERTYKLESGNYQIWVGTQTGSDKSYSSKYNVKVLEPGAPQ